MNWSVHRFSTSEVIHYLRLGFGFCGNTYGSLLPLRTPSWKNGLQIFNNLLSLDSSLP